MSDKLSRFGELYRSDDGYEVWRIRDENGNIAHEDIASDHDAQWLAEQV